jgi:hypothetical protein
MAKKVLFDANQAFKNIVGVNEEPVQEPVPEKKEKPAGERLVQKAYYITEREYKALKLRAAMSDDKDMSGLVREALELYLRETLDSLPE